MKLSVLIVTYNHEKYIVQALDGVLMQEVDFEYEIVVGEDCSADSTRAILLEYKRKYPDKFKLLLHDKNQGACANFVQSFKACSGDYIAYLEGDDYWISRNKLQLQVDMLEANPEFSICFHNCEEFYEDNSKPPWNYCPKDQKEITSLTDLITMCNFIPSCSVVFRNHLFSDFPEWYYKLAIGDWTLHILNAQHGNIAYIDKVMGRHRHHGGGVWSLRNQIQNILDVIHAYEVVDGYFDYQYAPLVNGRLSLYYYDLANIYGIDSLRQGLKYLFIALAKSQRKFHMMPGIGASAGKMLARKLKGIMQSN